MIIKPIKPKFPISPQNLKVIDLPSSRLLKDIILPEGVNLKDLEVEIECRHCGDYEAFVYLSYVSEEIDYSKDVKDYEEKKVHFHNLMKVYQKEMLEFKKAEIKKEISDLNKELGKLEEEEA